jgi:hypothetical protein
VLELSTWDHARGALLALVLVVHGIAASPLPKSVKRSQLESPIGREELDHWVNILGGVGVTVTRAELEDATLVVGSRAADVRRTLLGPFQPWFRFTGTGQGWGLFTTPDTFPHQLVVEVRRGETWETVYAGLDPDATWNRDRFAYRRLRGVYDGNTRKPGASYDNFVAQVGAWALADFPDASAARVGFVRFHTRAPDQPPDPERAEKFKRAVAR